MQELGSLIGERYSRPDVSDNGSVSEKAQHPIDFEKQWLENEDRIAKYSRISLEQYQDCNIKQYFDLQELYLNHLEEERSRSQHNPTQ